MASIDSVSPAERLTGTVRWYNHKKGFGFVTPDDGSEDIFLHHSAVQRSLQPRLDEGERVAFGVEHRKKGPSAVDVTPLGERVAPPAAAPRAVEPSAQAQAAGPSFADLGLIDPLLRAVADSGYVEPTPIQEEAIPYVLDGADLMGAAQTGTGKTAAFALPILQRLVENPVVPGHSNGKKAVRPIRVLVLSPTRELAIQIKDSFKDYGKYTPVKATVIHGGVGQGNQVQALQRGVDVLVATPGRLLDLIGPGLHQAGSGRGAGARRGRPHARHGLHLRRAAHRQAGAVRRPALLFSATLPQEIVDLASSMLRKPISVSVTPDQPAVEAIEQKVFFVPKQKKQDLLEQVLRDRAVTRALVFTRTKHGANKVVKNLVRAGIPAEPIHGNKSQTARQQALENFRAGRTRVLVATDVASRGIDVEDISHVIQFDLPNDPGDLRAPHWPHGPRGRGRYRAGLL